MGFESHWAPRQIKNPPLQSISGKVVSLLDIPMGWDCTNQQPAGLLVARPLAVPCFSSPTGHPHKKSPLLKTAAGGSPVDIPRGWNPQANQQPTGLLVALPLMRQSRLVRVPLGTPPNKKSADAKHQRIFWWGAQWDSNPRSPDPQSGALTDYAMGTT